MAVVGVVTTIGCPYCKKAKAALKDQGVEYEEAELSTSRDILAKVKETTGQATVPQVFIGGEFLGGATQLLALISAGKLPERVSAAEGKQAFPGPISQLLAELPKAEDKSGPDDSEIDSLRRILRDNLERTQVNTKDGPRKSVAEAALTTFLEAECGGASIKKLLECRLIAPIPGVTGVSGLYQLTDDARALPVKLGSPLNGHIAWHGDARSAVDVSADLRARILELYDAYLAPDGKAVDYEGMKGDSRFDRYVDATVELTKVDLSTMSREEKIAFFINVYNALIVHGTVAHGTPSNFLERLKFFRKVNYVIGGVEFTADDIEHGVLRSNAVAPGTLVAQLKIKFLQKSQFPAGDPRAALAVTPMDPRIHFALVCGAKSCPPIKLYTPDNLDEGLQDAGVAFCESEVEVSTCNRTVVMSKIFDWYGKDFAVDDKERLAKIAEFCTGQKKEQLQLLAMSSDSVKLKYKTYDWSVNSK